MLSAITIYKTQLRNQNEHMDLTLHLYKLLTLDWICNPCRFEIVLALSNKHQRQRASFQNKSFLNKIDVILCGYMTDVYGVYPVERIVTGIITEDPEICFSSEEVDSRIIPHIGRACQEEIKRVVVISNNTDVVIYSLAYH